MANGSAGRDRAGVMAATAGILIAALTALVGHAVTQNADWALWLQNGVNAAKIVELGAVGFAAYQFWAGRAERRGADEEAAARARKDATYQAWQVVNSAQGKGGSGGRVDALADLARHGVSLAGVNLEGAWLEGVDLRGATLMMATFENANLQHARFDGARLDGANFRGADLVAASLAGASLKGAELAGARLSAADLSAADLTDVRGWREATIGHANVEGVRAAPAGFAAWALANGAVTAATDHTPADAHHSRHFRAL